MAHSYTPTYRVFRDCYPQGVQYVGDKLQLCQQNINAKLLYMGELRKCLLQALKRPEPVQSRIPARSIEAIKGRAGR